MTIYTSGLIGPDQSTLENFDASTSESVGAAARSAYQGNISVVAKDASDLYTANTGKDLTAAPTLLHTALFGLGGAAYDMYQNIRAPDTTKKVDKTTAEQQIKDAGVALTVPEQGYSQAALDMLIQRKRDTLQTEDVLNRAPKGIGNASLRFGASLAASLVDPLNIASAFIPVIGEARYAGLLAEAGGIAGRTAIRAGVGAAEGAVGAAILEPGVYAGRNQLQDDYTMADSLENIAFGSVFGGGLHTVGGAIGERLNAAMGRPQSWEHASATTLPGTEPPLSTVHQGPGVDANRFSDDAFQVSSQIDTGQMSLEQFSRLYDENPALAKQVVELRTGDRPTIEAAPQEKGLSIEAAKAQALTELTPDFRAELTANAGNLADKGAVADLKTRQADIQQQLDAITSDRSAAFKAAAKDLQSTGLSRKKAETAARKQLADQETELNAQFEAVGQQIETNAKAQQATNDLARLEQGQAPDQFAARIEDRANQLIGRRNLINAVALPSEVSARFIVSNVSPEIRRSALSGAISQFVQGKVPDVQDIIKLDTRDPLAVDKLTETQRRSTQPEASATTSPEAARAAQERLDMANPSADYQAAEAAMAKSMERLTAAEQNLALANKSFTTEKGSTYKINSDGTTTRNKAARAEHPGESGIQPASKRTVYVSFEDVQKLGEVQTKGGPQKGLIFNDAEGKIGIRYLEGKDAGKIEGRTVVPFSTEPAVGLYPVESFGDDKTVHFGNKITSLGNKIIDTAAELKPFDDAIKTADDYGKAVRAAALCGMRS